MLMSNIDVGVMAWTALNACEVRRVVQLSLSYVGFVFLTDMKIGIYMYIYIHINLFIYLIYFPFIP